MKNKIYICIIGVMILLTLLQGVIYAAPQYMNNTAPVANFTVEKNRNVKILVLSDYTGTDSANLKNSITSMKSELTNDAKVDVEYVTPTDISIGTQQGFYKQQYWGMLAHGYYRVAGTDTYENYYYGTYTTTNVNKTENVSVSHSPTVVLPEGESPTAMYNVPVRYTHTTSDLLPTSTGSYQSERYKFYDSSGSMCDGGLSITINQSSASEWSLRAFDYTITTQPVLTYDNFWSVMDSYDQPITNTVPGWDLSKINYNVTDNTDTYVVFAMNNEDTNYYKTHNNTYRLGQLRSDANLGKYVKDSEARVYSICSDNFENVNLSTNPEYPITLTSTKQNISVKDLINKSIDGRSLGVNNVSGLVNKIKENIKKPTNANVDMIVATDKDTVSTNSFIDSIKNDISSDVDLKANVLDATSFEDTSTWTKYIVNGDYKNIKTGRDDITLILTGNGDLWAMGNNCIFEDYTGKKLGLFGLSTTIDIYSNFVKIATGVKDVRLDVEYLYSTLVLLKNDGTIWTTGVVGSYVSNNVEYRRFNTIFTRSTEFSNIYDISSGYLITNTGKVYVKIFAYDITSEDTTAPYSQNPSSPVHVQYIYAYHSNYSRFDETCYFLSDGSVYYKRTNHKYEVSYRTSATKLTSPVKKFSSANGLIYCEDNNIYDIRDMMRLNINPVKQEILEKGYFVDSNSDVYYHNYDQWEFSRINKMGSNVDKLLFIDYWFGGIIVRYLNGEIGYIGRLSVANLLPLSSVYRYDEVNGIEIIDASCNGMAGDYLQVGNWFAYVSKLGELFIPTVSPNTAMYSLKSYGKFDPILDISTKPVKAFSKTKLLSAPLREGSERYFIYISDNVEKDTYFKSPSDYFLFSNLDSTILNYLNTNKFNIYVMTPAQALDLKLQYPYVPVNKQQYTLRDLVNNASKDSSICRDINTVRTLISRKFAAFTKQGSTTLTLIADEEGMNYNLVYRDFENDPKYADKWQYTHDQTYFDNSNGLESYSGSWVTTPINSFSKVGKYTVVSQFRDNPKNISSFDSYRLWSNISAPATILVHRRPIAAFNTQIVSKVGTNVNLSYLDQSYDLDHNISRADKGIAARSWQYRKINTETWIEDKPINLTYNTGVYEIQLKVRDIEGAWSKPYVDKIDTANLVPTIDATPKTYEGYGAVNIIITANDNGENDFAHMRYAVTTSTAVPTATQWIPVTNSVKIKLITISTEGTYYVHMEAYDTSGQKAYRVRGPYIIENLKAGHFYISMILDVGWRSYYFDVDNGIDDDHDGEVDRYPRRANTDIDTLKMPINYFNLVGYARTYIKAGYKVKGKIDIIGNPDWAEFHINYIKEGRTYTDNVSLTRAAGDTYTFEWIIPLETDSKTFVSFDLVTKKGNTTYGNEKWIDTWDARNTSRLVFYIKGKATDDLIYVQSQ